MGVRIARQRRGAAVFRSRLAVDAGRGLTAIETASLQEAFEESELPWRVDVVDVQTISESFKTRVFAVSVLFTTLAYV